ncbi:efflux RND transporter periplasmic adaptor subunit [Marinilabiliaceae bacterium ANBcel2]|nr:efflux RND transporter periplasmic adaptor subunit [Marinilabiliaceae bacterium ANBcel2]
MQNRKKTTKVTVIVVAALFLAGIGYWMFSGSKIIGDIFIEGQVQRGSFVAEVYSSGQLQAENATVIEVPSELSSRSINIHEIQVTDIVEEGTVVEKGDWVASLDHSAVEELLDEAQDDLERAIQDLEDARIDTNINMSNLRDGLIDSEVAVEERALVVEQSVYESPAVQRQAALDLERAKQNLEQAKRNYELQHRQARYSVQRAEEEVERYRERVRDMENLFEALDIHAPMPGMVIYSYDRFGNKIQVGSSVSRWMPVIAELPDLSTMISVTYINEIDISRIDVGQTARVGVDAFPEKRFDGEVISVANIGQSLPDGSTKVFEVTVRLDGSDPELRPAMTTSNVITVSEFDDVLYIPLETVFRNDSLKFVYAKDNKLYRQIIDTGTENATHVVVREGVHEGQTLLFNEPSTRDDIPWVGEDIYKKIIERREEARRDSLDKIDQEDIPSEDEIPEEIIEEGFTGEGATPPQGQGEGMRRGRGGNN